MFLKRTMIFFNRHNLKAAAIHLCISGIIAVLTVGLVYGVWYPHPLNQALEVGNIFLMLLGIDLALGPLLTLVVYKPLKKTLTFDLTVIGCIQLAALLYGINTVAAGRPAYMVFTKDRFDLVLAYDVATVAGTANKPTLVLQNPWSQPLWGYQMKSAAIPKESSSSPLLDLLTGSALGGGPDIPNITSLHAHYANALPLIQATAKPLSALDKAVDFRAKYPSNSIALPLKIKFTIYTVVLNSQDGTVLGIEPVDVF
jgi:hypothetical protein